MGKPGRDRAPSLVNPGDSACRQTVCHEGPPTRSRWGGYHLFDQMALWGRKASSTRKVKPQISNLKKLWLIPSFSGAIYACATLFGSPLLLRLSATLGFSLK